ncbi:MAG: hypothetical protein ACERKD_18645 [Prolixibacteraceae bacterium]
MNYIKQLLAVFEKMDADTAITPFHLSLYMALFRRWNLNFFRNPIAVSRDELMRHSKIGSVNTYTKCLKELDRMGYLKYEPSYNPHRGSVIYLFSFDNGSEQAVRPLINNTNPENMDKQAAKFDLHFEKQKKMKSEESGGQQYHHEKPSEGFGPDIPPSQQHVRIYFDEKGYSPVEGEKFFNYFQSNGWLVGGRSKMKDWKAAARNWMLNSQRFNNHGKHQRNNQKNPKPGKLQTRRDKDYSEPL